MTRAPRWRWGDAVEELIRHLADGGLLAIPSESSYGLAADPRSRRGVAAIYGVKGRPDKKALPVVVADTAQAIALGVSLDAPALTAVAPLWPAPLSVVLPLDRPLAAAAGGMTLAVRVPAHRRLRLLLAALGFGLTATSANRSGHPPVTDPEALDAVLGGHPAIVVDDGPLPGGPPSTLVAWRRGDGFSVLRPGAFPIERLAEAFPSDEARSAAGGGYKLGTA